jgi:predicted transcriptional regulator
MTNLDVAVSSETAMRAKAAADARGESLDAFVEHALNEALDEQRAFEQAIAEADRDIAEGRTHSWEEVKTWLDASRVRAEAEIARRQARSA